MGNAFSKLPEVSAARLPSTGEAILIHRGESGYYPTPNLDPDEYNRSAGVDAYQAEAMVAGSMWGWENKGADPDTYKAKGLVPVPGRAFTELQATSQ